MIAIADFGMGNLRSVAQALARVAPQMPACITSDPDLIDAAERIVLPGQGAMPDCMRNLAASGLEPALRRALAGKPVLAISYPETEMAHLISRIGCGWIVEPGDTAALAMKITELVDYSLESLELKGKAGREYALAHMVSEVCLPRVSEIITKASY